MIRVQRGEGTQARGWMQGVGTLGMPLLQRVKTDNEQGRPLEKPRRQVTMERGEPPSRPGEVEPKSTWVPARSPTPAYGPLPVDSDDEGPTPLFTPGSSMDLSDSSMDYTAILDANEPPIRSPSPAITAERTNTQRLAPIAPQNFRVKVELIEPTDSETAKKIKAEVKTESTFGQSTPTAPKMEQVIKLETITPREPEILIISQKKSPRTFPGMRRMFSEQSENFPGPLEFSRRR